jgi:multidrug transporter EmrE-like cation transporter
VVIGLFLFRETLDAVKVLGMGLVIAGRVVLNGVGAATAQ